MVKDFEFQPNGDQLNKMRMLIQEKRRLIEDTIAVSNI